jgi:type IV secretory pathway TraG/TraD family ATPase VirD4
MPVLEFGRETARLCQVLMKIAFARGWLRHQYRQGCCHGAFLYIDEAAFLMSRMDSYLHMVCRSSGIAPFLLMQNILSIAADEFGEQQPGSKTLGFLGLLGTKIFLANNETQTNQYASDQIGKTYAYIEGWNAGQSEHDHHSGVSANKQLVHIIEPIEFTRLMKPDGENPLSEGIVYLSGSTFNATKNESNPRGLPYLRVHFSR